MARDVIICADETSSDDSVESKSEDDDDDDVNEDVSRKTSVTSHDMDAVENYFESQTQASHTSDQTLAKLRIPRMDPEQLAEALKVGISLNLRHFIGAKNDVIEMFLLFC